MSPADDIFSGKNKFDGELSDEDLGKVAGGACFFNCPANTDQTSCFADNPCKAECRGDMCMAYGCGMDQWSPCWTEVGACPLDDIDPANSGTHVCTAEACLANLTPCNVNSDPCPSNV